MEEKKNNRKLYLLLIILVIFILTSVGATYAFFHSRTRSKDDDVTTRSASISLEYVSYGSAWSNNDLIPTTRKVAEYAVELQNDTTLGENELNGEGVPGKTDKNNNTLCKDDNGNSVCSIYEFQIKNNQDLEQAIDIELETENNAFDNLNAMFYEVSISNNDIYSNVALKETPGNNGYGDPIFKVSSTDGTEGAIAVKDNKNNELYNETPIYINRNGVSKTLLQYETTPEDENENLAYSMDIAIPRDNDETKKVTLANGLTIANNETKTFIVVMYILEKDNNQSPNDANKSFRGNIIINSNDGTRITGSI